MGQEMAREPAEDQVIEHKIDATEEAQDYGTSKHQEVLLKMHHRHHQH
jgi:hypothetical protein